MLSWVVYPDVFFQFVQPLRLPPFDDGVGGADQTRERIYGARQKREDH